MTILITIIPQNEKIVNGFGKISILRFTISRNYVII